MDVQVPPPAWSKPTDSEFYTPDSALGALRINHDFIKQHFFREGRLTEAQALLILETAIEVLKREDNLVAVQSPVTICGDIHGQYYDLMKLFDVGGDWNENRYLFLGDYVDRGAFGIECLLYLYTLKINFPARFTLLRGNHECRHLTEYFTFKKECLHKYSEEVYEKCIQSFCALPLGAIVDGRFFCVHGGLSPELLRVEDMRRINRFVEPGNHGLLCDLLWSDPYPGFGKEQEAANQGGPLKSGTTFMHNSTRGCSYYFTYEAACQFLERNGLLGIIRGHEAQDAGYSMFKKTPNKKFPSVITIFSAPNYLDVYHNRGAVLKYSNKNITIRQYNSSPHPYWLPNFMDAFTWSLPFVGSKITEMLLAVLSVCSRDELEDSDSDSDGSETKAAADAVARRQQIKNKIIAVGRMQRVFQLLRQEAENTTELYLENPAQDGSMPYKSPSGLSASTSQLDENIHNFDEARRSDIINERLPEFGTMPGTVFPSPSMRLIQKPRRSATDSIASSVGPSTPGVGGIYHYGAQPVPPPTSYPPFGPPGVAPGIPGSPGHHQAQLQPAQEGTPLTLDYLIRQAMEDGHPDTEVAQLAEKLTRRRTHQSRRQGTF